MLFLHILKKVLFLLGILLVVLLVVVYTLSSRFACTRRRRGHGVSRVAISPRFPMMMMRRGIPTPREHREEQRERKKHSAGQEVLFPFVCATATVREHRVMRHNLAAHTSNGEKM